MRSQTPRNRDVRLHHAREQKDRGNTVARVAMPSEPTQDRVRWMMALVHHYGPDAVGEWQDPPAEFGAEADHIPVRGHPVAPGTEHMTKLERGRARRKRWDDKNRARLAAYKREWNRRKRAQADSA